MDKNLISFLDKYNIKYKIHTHPAVHTVEESKNIKEISNILNVLKITAISTMPASDFKDINLKAIESFEQYFQ